MVSGALLNYKDTGVSAAINDKAFERDGFTRVIVDWMRFTDSLDVVGIQADYLVICADYFFPEETPHSDIINLMQHRSIYNGYDVMAVNVKDILDAGFY